MKRSMGLLGLVASLGVACALTLTACGSVAQKDASASATQTEHVKVVLDYTPNTNHVGLYVAQAKGYFKDAGLDVEVVQPPEDGADGLVATGAADFGFSYQDTMANYLGSDQSLPVKAIAAVIQHNTSGIMSAKDSGITSFKDMDNHSYATWNMPIELGILKYCVNNNGGNFSTVKQVPCNTTDEVASLKNHEFDSIWVFKGWAVQNAELKHFDYNYIPMTDGSKVFDYYTPVVISSDKFIKEHPNTVKKFLSALKKGYEFSVKNPDEASEILCKQVPELDKPLVKASLNYLKDQFIADAPAWGVIDHDRWNAFYEWINKENILAKPLDTDAGLDTQFIGQN